MPTGDAERLSKANSPIDIAKVRNRAGSIQSHLSVSNSLKRLRISPGWYSSFPKRHTRDVGEILGQQSQRTRQTDGRAFLHESLSENGLRGGHLDRTCIKLIARYTFIAYCILSCIITTHRLYTFFSKDTHMQLQRPTSIHLPTMEMSVMTTYLLRAISCRATFEPFVLSNGHRPDNQISFVGWLNESEVDFIRTWNTRWPGMFHTTTS
jgi:hypothetical protein